MDRYKESNNVSDLEQARRYYAEAFEKAPDDYYTGINAAAKSILLGTDQDLMIAEDYAKRTLKIIGTSPWPNDYWKTATVAELLLIDKKYKNAGDMFLEAIKIEANSLGNHESTRNQAIKLLDRLTTNEMDRIEVLRAFEHLIE